MEEYNNQEYNNQEQSENNQNTQYTPPQYTPPTPQANKSPKTNAMAIASLVLGIVSLLFSCCCGLLSFPCGIAGLILGIFGLKDKENGKEMAIAGIIMSSLAILLGIISIITVLIMGATNADYNVYYNWDNLI